MAKKTFFLTDTDIEDHSFLYCGTIIGYPENVLMQIQQQYMNLDPDSNEYKDYMKRKTIIERRIKIQEKASATRARNIAKKNDAEQERRTQISTWVKEQDFEYSHRIQWHDLYRDYIKGKIIDFDHVTTQLTEFHKQYVNELQIHTIMDETNTLIANDISFYANFQENIRFNQSPDYHNTPAEDISQRIIQETHKWLIQFWTTPKEDIDHRQQEFDECFQKMKNKYEIYQEINGLCYQAFYVRQLYIYGGDKLVIIMLNNNLTTLEEMATCCAFNMYQTMWEPKDRETFLELVQLKLQSIKQSTTPTEN